MQAGSGETESAFGGASPVKRPATVPVLVWDWNEDRREAPIPGLLCAHGQHGIVSSARTARRVAARLFL